jgi:hypothetical protein
MNKEVKLPDTEHKNEEANEPEAKPSKNGGKSGISATQAVKTKRRRAKSKKGISTMVWIAIIGSITTIITTIAVALFNFPPFIAFFNPDPTLTPTAAMYTPTIESLVSPTVTLPTSTEVFPTSTETLSPTATEISPTVPEAHPTVTITPTATLFIGMDVQLTVDRTSGGAPLTVRFDARGSFLRALDGTIYRCQSGACNFTWFVYKGNNQLNEPKRSSDGTLIYTFSKRGDYRVAVKVCRGQGESDCASDGDEIIVK